MEKKKRRVCILLLVIMVSNIWIAKKVDIPERDSLFLEIVLKADEMGEYQVFFSQSSEFSEEKSQKLEYSKKGHYQTLVFEGSKNAKYIRLDLGNRPGMTWVKESYLKHGGVSKKLSLRERSPLEQKELVLRQGDTGVLEIQATGTDPYLSYALNEEDIADGQKEQHKRGIFLKIFLVLFLDFLLLFCFRKWNRIVYGAKELGRSRYLIGSLAKNDFKTKYAGSYLGIIWAFVNPMITIAIYWFVFQYGLKAGSPVEDTTFIFWLMTGLIPWFFFQDALLNATNCMLEYSYLVKKVVFKISVLPIVKVLSSLFVHGVFVVFLLGVGSLQGKKPDILWIQLLYYTFCAFFLVLGVSYATASIVLFFRDLSQVVGIFLQIGLWLTPIMWPYGIVPERYRWILKLNPMFYVVEGYRDTLIYQVWFWHRYVQTLYFWGISLTVFIGGRWIFKKLKPHFSDVL